MLMIKNLRKKNSLEIFVEGVGAACLRYLPLSWDVQVNVFTFVVNHLVGEACCWRFFCKIRRATRFLPSQSQNRLTKIFWQRKKILCEKKIKPCEKIFGCEKL